MDATTNKILIMVSVTIFVGSLFITIALKDIVNILKEIKDKL